ncbi:MAG: phage minor head protein [Fulvivirga sp.]
MLYDGQLAPGDVDEELYNLTAQELMAGVERGLGTTLAKADDNLKPLIDNLRNNVYVFSGFKTYHQLREATDLLVDDLGRVRSFNDFKTKVLELSKQYNTNFLRSEYNHAIASAQMAKKWRDIEADREALPLLQYITAGDSRVRQSHRPLDLVTLPVDHPFWDTYMPPNDWGCRCSVRQLAEGTQTRIDKLQSAPELKEMFRLNTGKDQIIFPRSHPYYTVLRQHESAARNNFGLDIPPENA